jgi:amino acid transporter
MLFIAFAYRELNNEIPDCGTTFTWGTKAFGPWVGWMGGWGVAVAGMVVLANLAQIASIYFWALFGLDLANNDWRIILVAVIFIAAMTWVSWRGVEIGERIQNILLAVQYIALAIFVVAALWEFFAGTAPNPRPSTGTG